MRVKIVATLLILLRVHICVSQENEGRNFDDMVVKKDFSMLDPSPPPLEEISPPPVGYSTPPPPLLIS